MKKSYFKEFLLVSRRFFALAGIFIFLVPCLMDAQTQNIRFKHLTANDGLSQSWVRIIKQDKYGFMWFGTDDGLNRYDGYNFHVYKNNLQDKYSISNNTILTINEDRAGDLWIGTRRGLNRYDRENDRFIRYPQFADMQILSNKEDEDKNIWIGTSNGLFYLDVKNNSVQAYSANTLLRDKGYLSGNDIRAIIIDSRKNVWIGTSNGLNLYDKEKKLFVNYYYDDKNTDGLNDNDIRSILEDKDGRIWIGTSAGLDLFTNAHEYPQKGTFEHYRNRSTDEKSISIGSVISLLEDDKHNLWIGTENGGLDLFNLNTFKKGVNNFMHFRNDPNSRTSLNNNSIYSLFQDKQNNIWIGTFGNGINIISSVADKFIHFKSEPGNKNSLNNDHVNVFLEENNYLWIGTEGGLNRYNKKDGVFKFYVHDPFNIKSIGSNAVWALCKDKQGNLWVGTWGGGLNRFDYNSETFEHYYYNTKDTNSIGSDNIFSIYEDSKGNLWIGTMGGGLNIFDRKRKIFTRYNGSNSTIATNYVSSIIGSKEDDLWLNNEISYERFHIKTREFKNYIHSANDSTSISGNKPLSIFEDSKENLWMGTGNGLNLFNKSTEGFTCYKIEDGLPSSSVNGILEDSHGNLWLSTNKGLSKFINAINHPAKPEFKNYVYEDGLQSNEFTQRSCYKGTDGMLYFGGTNGFNMFDPDKITDNTYIPPIVISDFQIFNKHEIIGNRGLKENVDTTEDLVLSYKQSVFSFDFSALNYIYSLKNQYAYKMEGFDKDWNYVGTKHTATYTNLDPGKYIFRVKGSNNDGVWNEKGVALPIVITPPYWLTLWFRLLLVVVAAGIAFWIYKWRMQARDLAAQKRMEVALTKERNLLRTLIDNLPDAVFVKDKEGKKIIANPVDLRFMGAESEKDVIGKTDFDFYPADVAASYYAVDQSVIQSGVPIVNGESYILDKQGNKIHTLYFKIPLRDEQGKIIGLVGVAHDITNFKRIQETLQKERTILRTLIDNLPDAVFVKDNKCRKIIANIADVRNMHLQTEAEALGKDDFDLFPKELAEGFAADDRMVIETGQPVLNREEYIYDENGQKLCLDTSKIPLRDEKGQIIGLVGIGRDITERKRAEEEREKLIKELQDAVADIKVLSGLVPICSSCKKIRDDKGYWTQLEGYIQAHSQAKFSHGVCPDCMKKLYPNYVPKKIE